MSTLSGVVTLEGRPVLVAGGTRGIGLAVARALRAAGADLLIAGRSTERGRAAADELGAEFCPADLATEAGVADLHAKALARWGQGPELLVNTLGAFELAPLHQASIESFDRQIAANLRAPFLLIRAFLAEMRTRGRGHIVTIGSIAGRHAFPNNGAYSASKFGVRGLHAVLAEELRGTGVRATLIEPAATDTPLWDDIDRASNPGLPRRETMMDPDAVAAAVVFAATQNPAVSVPNLIVERS